MRKLGLLLAVAGLVVLATGCAKSAASTQGSGLGTWTRVTAAVRARFTNGKTELQRAVENKSKAKSWRMRTEMRLHPGDPLVTVSEVVCPDRQRLTGALGEKNLYEAIRVGGESYVREADKDNWQSQPISTEFYPCGANPGMPAPWAILNEGRDMTATLALLSRQARPAVNVGTFEAVDGVPCQNWEVVFGHPGKQPGPGSMMNYTICIDANTHLPLRITMGKGGISVVYYDWNKPMNIAVPQVAANVAHNQGQ